jgi:hypothetical protein
MSDSTKFESGVLSDDVGHVAENVGSETKVGVNKPVVDSQIFA